MTPAYTRRGDDGSTGLPGEERLPKHSLLIETLGTLDEASAALGLARALNLSEPIQALLAEVQRDLYSLMAELAYNQSKRPALKTLESERIQWLEAQIDTLAAGVPAPGGFILPGDSPAGAALSMARTVVRRAERRVAELQKTGPGVSERMLPYLNRLSSLCFILELEANRFAGRETSTARPAQDKPG